jgi:hypothetical protein
MNELEGGRRSLDLEVRTIRPVAQSNSREAVVPGERHRT